MRRPRPARDLPVGLVVIVAFAVVLTALAGMMKVALAIVLLAFAAGWIARLAKGR
jgi:hypothetical protein